MAYDWLGNVAHEVVGAAMFLLLVSHNIFNRRWYGTIVRARRDGRWIISKAITLSLLMAMIALLVTSVMISEAVFSFLPLKSTFTARRIHAMVAYLVLFIAALHLGLAWSMIMSVVKGRFRIAQTAQLRTWTLRGLAVTVAAYGVYSLFALNVGSKLFMQMTFEFWDFERAALAFFLHHIAIVGLFACLSHYSLKALQRRRGRAPAG
ncbi:DUF4405 domain-containing protein [Mesorhizobium sp. M7A.T.Ca.TU.009.01.3.2]|nr:DUF4405 domain-containing protein [Mesorhizobium sp. M7A.T.Ca.TU.009.01.3.2]